MALQPFPRFKLALSMRGRILLELGRPVEALETFETLLAIDNSFPQLSDWLVYATVAKRRVQQAQQEQVKKQINTKQ